MMHINMYEDDHHLGRRVVGTRERTDGDYREDRTCARRFAGADCTRERPQVGGPRWDRLFGLDRSQAPIEAGDAVILVDSSVWIEHFRSSDSKLREILEQGSAVAHPFVVGELALGHLRKRDEVLSLMGELPKAPHLSDDEVLGFVEAHRLAGTGI